MSIRFFAAEPGERYDLDAIRNAPKDYSLEEVICQMGYSDVERLINAATNREFLEIAEQYAFFVGLEAPELECVIEADAEQEATEFYKRRFYNSLGYIDLRTHMQFAIALNELLKKEVIEVDDLREVEIFAAEPAAGHREMLKEMGRLTNVARSVAGMADPLAVDCERNRAAFTKTRYRCILGSCYADSPYAKHLKQGMLHASKQDGLAFGLAEVGKGFMFDIVNDHFSDSPSGYREAVSKAFETLFRINLWDMVLTMKDGRLTLAPRSVYSAFWYQLARGIEGGRAMKCEACGKPLIAFDERGMKRKYCSEACKKWAHRHPGEKRPMRR